MYNRSLRKYISIIMSIIMMASIIMISTGSTFAETTTTTENKVYGFEDGTTMGWIKRNSETIEATKDKAHTGDYSLKVSGRTKTWEGPQLSFTSTAKNAQTYDVTAWVYVESDKPSSVGLTAYKKDGSGESYKSVSQDSSPTANTWVKLEGSYTVEANDTISALTFYIESSDTSYNIYLDDVNFSVTTPSTDENYSIETDIPSLKDVYKDYFKIGVAVPTSSLTNDVQKSLIEKHFDSITAENDMKPETMQPKEGEFDYTKSDKYVEYTQANNMRLRGHTLIWHSQIPEWFFVDENGKDVSRDVLLKRMETHIKTLIKKYGDKVECWDVVNEAADQNDPKGLRNSKFRQIIGDDYIEKAFQYAKEAVVENGLKTRLFYNDYNSSSEDQVRTKAICDIVKNLKAKNLVDGIGYQTHISIDTPIGNFKKSMEQMAALGVDIEITELDMVVNSAGLDKITDDVLVKQGYKYKQIMDVLKSYKDKVTGVTLWGLKDDMSWLAKNKVEKPLLFDSNYKAKYAYWGLVDPSKLPAETKYSNTLKSKVKIDGKVNDDAWKINRPSSIKDSLENEIGNFMTSWYKDKLYFKIKLNNKFESVDLYIDENNSKDKTFKEDDFKYSITNKNKVSSKNVNSKIKKVSNGYIIEGSIPIKTVTLAKNVKLGFDICVNTVNSKISWNDFNNTQGTDTSKYGITIMKDPKYIEAVKSIPVIDGKVNGNEWKKAQPVTTDLITQGTDPAKAEVKTLWSKDYLYVLADVKDPVLSDLSSNPWEQDSIEIFIDENMNRTGYYEDDDVQYRISYKNAVSIGGDKLSDKFKSATSVTDTGYIVEVAIPFKEIKAEKNNFIDFDIQINDDGDGKGKRTGMSNWNDDSKKGYMNTSEFGILKFSKR